MVSRQQGTTETGYSKVGSSPGPRRLVGRTNDPNLCDVLGTNRETLGIDTNFFDIGGHSLKATILAARIHKTFNVKLPLVEIFKQPSIGGQAAYIKNAAKDKYIPITPVEKKEYYDCPLLKSGCISFNS